MNGIITDFSQIGQLTNKYGVKQSNLNMPYEDGYATASDVYSIVSRIAKNGKTLDWNLKIKTGDNIEDINDGELFDLINNPNINQSRQEFVEMAIVQLLLGGEGFMMKDQPIGHSIESVELLVPQFISLNTKAYNMRNNLINYEYSYGGTKSIINKEIITHYKYSNPTLQGFNSMRGLSPLVAGYLTLKSLNNNQLANATIIENLGVSGILSNEGERALTDSERNMAQKALDSLLKGVMKFGSILQSSSKVTYTKLGLDPTQLKLIESKILKMRDLCSIYDVKSILFNDPQSSTHNNLLLAEKSFWTNAVIPNTQSVLTAFDNGIVKDFNNREFANGRSKYFIELDTSKIKVLQADERLEAQKDKVKMDGIAVLLGMPITTQGKIELLVSEYGYNENDAAIIAAPSLMENPQV